MSSSNSPSVFEPTMEQFLAELNKYKIVRDRNFQANLLNPPLEEKKSNSQTENPNKTERQKGTNFEEILEQYLKTTLNLKEDEVKKVMIEFRKAYQKYLTDLSLDDIERLAAQLLHSSK